MMLFYTEYKTNEVMYVSFLKDRKNITLVVKGGEFSYIDKFSYKTMNASSKVNSLRFLAYLV